MSKKKEGMAIARIRENGWNMVKMVKEKKEEQKEEATKEYFGRGERRGMKIECEDGWKGKR